MTESAAVIIGTYGDKKWSDLAKKAYASAENQTYSPLDIIHIHTDSLANARNKGASMTKADWLIFLDADDELDKFYIENMLQPGKSTLRQPSTLGVYPDGSEDECPVLIPERSLIKSNFLVIGSMCRRKDFLEVRGFDPSYPVLEDWDLWLRLKINGAIIGKRPDAIYRVGVNKDSRNQNSRLHGRYYSDIRRKYRNAF